LGLTRPGGGGAVVRKLGGRRNNIYCVEKLGVLEGGRILVERMRKISVAIGGVARERLDEK